MSELKTKPTTDSVQDFLDNVTEGQRREDSQKIVDLMSEVTEAPPILWGSSIIGFGRYHYKYESGRENDWMLLGFSPRKNDLTLYIQPSIETFPEQMARLGKYKTRKSCLYIKKLDDIDLSVLREILTAAVEQRESQRIDRNALANQSSADKTG